MKNKKTTKKRYVVNFDMTWSHDIYVNANNVHEAKRLAWDKFSKRIKKSDFKSSVDNLD